MVDGRRRVALFPRLSAVDDLGVGRLRGVLELPHINSLGQKNDCLDEEAQFYVRQYRGDAEGKKEVVRMTKYFFLFIFTHQNKIC